MDQTYWLSIYHSDNGWYNVRNKTLNINVLLVTDKIYGDIYPVKIFDLYHRIIFQNLNLTKWKVNGMDEYGIVRSHIFLPLTPLAIAFSKEGIMIVLKRPISSIVGHGCNCNKP